MLLYFKRCCVYVSMLFQDLKRIVDEHTHVPVLSLGVIDLIPHVFRGGYKNIHYWKQLPVVRDEGFSDQISAAY